MGGALSHPDFHSAVLLKKIRWIALGLVLEIEELPTLSEASVAVLEGFLLQVRYPLVSLGFEEVL